MLRFATISDRGGREKNEDAIGFTQKDGIYCFVLADGLGGHGGGDIAASLAVSTITECFNAQAEISKNIMYAYLEAAQNAISEKRKESLKNANMATTITVLVTDGEKAIWAHCGDSRIYRIQKNLIQEITDDHTVAFASFVAGDISYDDIRYSPDQNKLLRSLNGGSKFKPDIASPVRVDKNTKFLMCSDGLWEYVDEDFMEKTLKKSQIPQIWLDTLAERRAKLAPPDADNYSAIVIYI